MRDRLTPPERHDIPNGRHRHLRNFVISEIGQAGHFGRVGRRAVAISVALFVLTSAGVAGAVLLNTEFDLETEVLPENRAEAIARLSSDVPLPEGGSFDALVDVDYTEDEAGLASTMAFNASCQWTGQWIDATLDNQPSRQLEAETMMGQVPMWPQITATDGGGVSVGLAAIAAAAVEGDLDTVVRHYQTNCTAIDGGRDTDLARWWPPEPGMASDPGPLCTELDITLTDLEAGRVTDPAAALAEAAELALSGPEKFDQLSSDLAAAAKSGVTSSALPSLAAALDALCGSES